METLSEASFLSQSMFLIQFIFEIDSIAAPRLRDAGRRIGSNSHGCQSHSMNSYETGSGSTSAMVHMCIHFYKLSCLFQSMFLIPFLFTIDEHPLVSIPPLSKHVTYVSFFSKLMETLSGASSLSQSMFLIRFIFEIDSIAAPRLRDKGRRIGSISHSCHIIYS